MFYTLNSTLLTEVSPTATFTSSKILIANLLATVFGLATLTILIFGVFATGDLTFGSKKEDEHDTDAPVLDFLYSILLSIFLSCSSMSFVFNLIFVCASVPDIVSPYPNYTHSPGMAFWIALAAQVCGMLNMLCSSLLLANSSPQLTPLAIVIVALIMLTVAYFFPNWEISETLIPRHSR
jgi:hypothetical protein